MVDSECPRCKSTKYKKSSMILMVNVCGHSLCDSCVEVLFTRGTGSCPQCGIAIRRSDFRQQQYEDVYVEKDLDARKKVLKIFNKQREDFGTDREYDDYLEMVENIIQNLTDDKDVEQTRELIEKYKKENKDLIIRNSTKLTSDDYFLLQCIEEEDRQKRILQQMLAKEAADERKAKRKNKEQLIDELENSEAPASMIVLSHKKKLEEEEKKKKVPSLTIRTNEEKVVPMPKIEKDELFTYQPLVDENAGPRVESEENLEAEGYLRYASIVVPQEMAGGYTEVIGCMRTLKDAFSGLFLFDKYDDSTAHEERDAGSEPEVEAKGEEVSNEESSEGDSEEEEDMEIS